MLILTFGLVKAYEKKMYFFLTYVNYIESTMVYYMRYISLKSLYSWLYFQKSFKKVFFSKLHNVACLTFCCK